MIAPIKFNLVVQGLHEKSDSIGFDCVYQYRPLREYFGQTGEVRLFAEKYDANLYRDCAIEDVGALHPELDDPQSIVIYHYCDSWPALETLLLAARSRVVLRWHNNTPPWFFAPYSLDAIQRTLAGFARIQDMFRARRFVFMCNSRFTRDQLAILGGGLGNMPVVYPASRYLDGRTFTKRGRKRSETRGGGAFKMLFVGRLAPHKGHRHLIAVAKRLQELAETRVVVTLPGRQDDMGFKYIQELKAMAEALDVELKLPGEVDNATLDQLYDEASVFLALSEHEGFGLPVYEAMSRQIPTGVWATTAFAEIVEGHPLAFARLDYDEIAQKLLSLKSPTRRQEIIDYQNHFILPEYTRETVKHQLIGALTRAAADSAVGGRPFSDGAEIPREIPCNFVTDHDMRISRFLLAQKSPGLIGDWEVQFIPATRFKSLSGNIVKQPFRVEDFGTDKHFIFGPYVELPAGAYRATFFLHFQPTSETAPASRERRPHFRGCVLDVAAGVKPTEIELSAADVGRASLSSVDFHLDHATSSVEFRIRFVDMPKGALLFNGVRLARLSRLDLVSIDGAPGDEGEATPYEIMASAAGTGFAEHAGGRLTLIDRRELLATKSIPEFVRLSYRRVFGRTPDEEGYRSYLQALETGAITPEDMIDMFVNSEEGLRRRAVYGPE